MRCPRCKKVSPKGYTRCAFCGAGLPSERDEGKKEIKMMKCPHCQRDIPEGSGYCRLCGNKISDNEPDNDQENIGIITEVRDTNEPEQKTEPAKHDFGQGMRYVSASLRNKSPKQKLILAVSFFLLQ